MSLGLSGAHRTGKTTLARAFAQQQDVPFVRTTASAVFSRLGLRPDQRLSAKRRLLVQREILDEFDRLYSAAGSRLFVADRTPLDLIGYTMVEIGQHSVPATLEGEIGRYVSDCIKVLNRHFSTVALVSPGIPVIADGGKASLSAPFIDHLALVIDGTALLPGIGPQIFRIPRHELSLSDRLASLSNIVERSVAEYQSCIAVTEEYLGSPITYH